ncbi:MAG: 30S ribosomal protein S12 methylthiotransferase RimO [Anaerolineales bacterium]|jgi:ribosomal protein S12 methylthiotransferase
MPNKTFYLISLGCAKNTVDSQSIAQLLERGNYHSTDDAGVADILIVNTCGFIQQARDESYQVLGDLAGNKRQGQLLVAAGCLTQRYGAEVVKRVPGIDGILGTRRWMDILELITHLRQRAHPQPLYHLPTDAHTVSQDEKDVIRAASTGPSAYLKIADGCRRPCAFCAIPLIKGTAISRPKETILREAQILQDQGIRELILIAQDTTDYGHDRGIKNGLASLLEDLVTAAPYVDWIRILYAFPGYVTDELIEVMAKHKQILPYLDMPLQHAHPEILRRMRRPANMDWVNKTIDKMRTSMSDLALRTTFLVGYPGETEEEFQTLMDFIHEVQFDRVGTFTFSFETGTSSEPLGDPIPEEVKQERLGRLMTAQQSISLSINQSLVGKTLDVLIEGHGEVEDSHEQIAVGRTYRDAPEIDGLVFIEGNPPIGDIVPVTINSAMVYDLTGTVRNNPHK